MEDWDEFIYEHSDSAVVEYVRAHPEFINTPDSSEQYLLRGAAFYLRVELVEQLLKLGAELNQLDPAGQLPLHSAIESYSDDPAKSLTLVKTLLNYGADIERRGYPDFTALHRACLSGSLDIVLLLLSHGANINARAEDRGDGGRRPLDVAEMHKHEAIVECLRAHGGNYA
jgi:ankyrin repeat protein